MHMLARPMGSLIIQPLRLNVRMQAGGGKGKASFKSGGGGGGRGAGRSSGGGGGIPPWKRYTKKTLGRQAEATLESVWMRTQWPSDDTIASLWNLHRLRRDQVLTWFQEKRKKERGGGGGSSSKAVGSTVSSVGTESIGAKTDWDAEWDPLEEPDEDDEDEEEEEEVEA